MAEKMHLAITIPLWKNSPDSVEKWRLFVEKWPDLQSQLLYSTDLLPARTKNATASEITEGDSE